MWIVIAVIVVAAIVGAAWMSKPSESPAAAPAEAGAGRAPHPAATLVELGGVRVVDLRSLPPEDLRVGRFGIAREQLRLSAPVAMLVWVIDAETARGWSELEEVAVVILAGNLNDPRSPCKSGLHVVGGALAPAAVERFARYGVETVLELTSIEHSRDAPTRELGSLLAPATPWQRPSDARPVMGATVLPGAPLDDMVCVLGDMAFVDLRRAPPAALRNGNAITTLAAALQKLAAKPASEVVVWVLAPWVLRELPADAAKQLAALLPAVKPRSGHRVALVAAAGEPVPSKDAVVGALLGAGAQPIGERYHLKTVSGQVFSVPPVDALHDSYFHEAWKRPRL